MQIPRERRWLKKRRKIKTKQTKSKKGKFQSIKSLKPTALASHRQHLLKSKK